MKWNEMKLKLKSNKTKQNKTKQNKTKQNKTKQNKETLCTGFISFHFISFHFLLIILLVFFYRTNIFLLGGLITLIAYVTTVTPSWAVFTILKDVLPMLLKVTMNVPPDATTVLLIRMTQVVSEAVAVKVKEDEAVGMNKVNAEEAEVKLGEK
jgi:hypothetical protein